MTANYLVPYWKVVRLFLRKSFRRLGENHPRLATYIKKIIHPLVKLIERHIIGVSYNPLISTNDNNLSACSVSNTIINSYQSCKDEAEYAPLVTVIVPNYNHEKYLRRRLDSIFNQTYKNFEVVLLDDCSTDNSIEILNEYCSRFPGKITLVVNESNSGGVFYQWQKGLNLSSGDIIWIAESDDFCSDNFLDILVPYFRNEAIQISYASTIFVKGEHEEPFWSIQEYLSDISTTRWSSAFVETAHNIVAEAFAIKNIIPNVSSALFRNNRMDILSDPAWQSMRTVGDWVLYLHLIRGGLLAYDPSATNYYRIHDKNTSVNSYSNDKFYREHELVAKTVRRYFHVDKNVFYRQKNNLIVHWQQTRKDYSDDKFESCYSLSRILEADNERMANLLMVGYGFCAGGGETFPILLANLMKDIGYNVTFLDCAQEERLPEIRQSLRSDIPVVSHLESLNEIVKDFNIDVIHSHHAWVDNTILDLLPSSTRAKTVVTLHGMYETISAFDLKNILPRLVTRSSCMVYTAEKNMSALRKHGYAESNKVTRIDNALEIYDFIPVSREELGVPDSAFLLTIVSRAIPDKGWAEAIDAVALARKEYGADIHLLLIGEGPVYSELISQGVPDFVHLLGFKKNIRSYFAVSDFGFLPSRFEGESFPLVIIDCFHAGTPVLASSVGEIPYMLKTEQGLAGAMFDLHDWRINTVELAHIIGKLSVDPTVVSELKNNVQVAARKFDPYILAEQYDAVYRKVLNQ